MKIKSTVFCTSWPLAAAAWACCTALGWRAAHRWAVPSVDTKTAAPLISRAGFVAWLKDFYQLKEVYGV